uniref:Tumor protein p53-inducible nuclear protein 1 isoform X1 n=1 Tax=Geotrypetes seraphini TaxID=260995 RepID=A0A6P8QR83_GEOSA|nr:tumor protein p53-inducible nuclear protein 1 isoform X1 [Geotrypetes seraphini]XP_033789071.1 tumor protein p53-inducible nuclear protein 1 isoform X1 [Geotrypetes seraphini]XP_033789072.1 tumor protein p53-inducible nuclear protein 1 isoform X1 [Geotrypetes seraphini]
MLQRLNMLAEEVNDTCDQDLEFSEKEDDDEWILVDLINSCTDFLKEETHVKKATSTDCSQNFSCTSASLDCLSESCFVQFDSCPMEESWFITPPPCFTAGGLTTLKVETSPMENLLIEHPSMSVYAVHNSCQSIQDNSCSEFPNPSQLRTETQNEMGQHISCYVAALAAHATFLEQTKHFRHTQWIKEHSDKHSLTRNSFRRQNLARDCHSRQIKHNSLLVHQPCQRQYNY